MIRLRYDSLLELPHGPTVEAWVVFTTPKQSHWWERFLEPGFVHCFALVRSGRRWIRMDWGYDCASLAVLNMPAYASLNEVVGPGDTVVRVLAEVRERYRAPWVFGPVTCVEAVKAVLGIRAFWVWTPFQLYRYIRSGRV